VLARDTLARRPYLRATAHLREAARDCVERRPASKPDPAPPAEKDFGELPILSLYTAKPEALARKPLAPSARRTEMSGA
jgi:hypothetical protein